MAIRARFLAGDDLGELGLGLAALGLDGAAGDLVGASLAAGHALVTGLPEEALAIVRELAARRDPTLPRVTEGTRPGAILLSGRLEQVKRAGALLQKRLDVPAAAEAGAKLVRACFHLGRFPSVRIGPHLAGAGRTLVMGVLNVTPDSFSDGGLHATPAAAVARARALVEAGADLLDVGGESTRPAGALYGEGAPPVDEAEERRRVLPVVEALAAALPDVPLSVDTSRASVAEAALAAGAAMVNDVRALADPALAEVVARRRVPACLMHTPAEPRALAAKVPWEDVIGEVAEALEASIERARGHGVDVEHLLVDPGFGFGKGAGENLFLLRGLRWLRAALGKPLLVGTSRKGFLGQATGRPVADRDRATAASVALAIQSGAAVVRVHDAAACRDAARIADAVAAAREGGSLFEP